MAKKKESFIDLPGNVLYHMVPISSSDVENARKEDKTFLETVKDTQKGYNAANIFGFIAYTRSHAHIADVLAKRRYWESFDEDSQGWIVFAIQPDMEKEAAEGIVVPNDNKVLLELFDFDDDYSRLPLFVLFSFTDNGEVKRFECSLDDSGLECAYNSIKGVLRDVTRAVNGMREENKKGETVFDVVLKQVEWPRSAKKTKQDIIRVIRFLKPVASAVKGFAG